MIGRTVHPMFVYLLVVVAYFVCFIPAAQNNTKNFKCMKFVAWNTRLYSVIIVLSFTWKVCAIKEKTSGGCKVVRAKSVNYSTGLHNFL